ASCRQQSRDAEREIGIWSCLQCLLEPLPSFGVIAANPPEATKCGGQPKRRYALSMVEQPSHRCPEVVKFGLQAEQPGMLVARPRLGIHLLCEPQEVQGVRASSRFELSALLEPL